MALSLTAKINFTFALTLAVFFGLAAGSYITVTSLLKSARWVSHSYQEMAELEQVRSVIQQAESTTRGYLLAGDRQMLAEHERLTGQLRHELERLGELVADNPAQVARLRALTPVIEERMAALQATIEERESVAPGEATVVVPSGRGTQLMSRISSALDEMQAQEKAVLGARMAALGAVQQQVSIVLTLSAGLILFLLVYGRSVLTRDLRLRQRAEADLQQANQRLSSGMLALEERTTELLMLNQMIDMFQSCIRLSELHQLIGEFAARILPGSSGGLYIMQASRNQLARAQAWGNFAPLAETFPPEDCWALRRAQPHVCGAGITAIACAHLPETQDREVAAADAGSSACIPIMAQAETLGLLLLRRKESAAFEERALRMAQSLAEQASLALANLRLREDLRAQSVRDPLTGLFNRRYLEEAFQRELQRAQRRNAPLSVIMLDLDHFKRFNDTFGHAAGDLLLREVADLLRRSVRAHDVPCRFGGEEFLVLLTEAELNVAVARAQQMREDIRRLNLQHRGESLGAITCSVGIAEFPTHADSVEGLLDRADAALYRAKMQGRDRVVVAANASAATAGEIQRA